jgi:molybdopterin molybdotransferase
VAVLSNGNELVDAGAETAPGKIVDSNRPTILSLVKASGGEPVDLGIIPDDRGLIVRKIERNLGSVDMVLVSGGTSVGEKDLLPDIVNSLGKPGVIVHGVAMRPGRPAAICALGLKPILLLPGFPVAAMMAYEVFAEPIMLKLMGARSRAYVRPTLRASALRRIPSIIGTRSFVRVLVMKKDDRTVFEPLRATGSGVISSMVKANGMLIIPENKEGVEEGEQAEITLLRPLEDGEIQ